MKQMTFTILAKDIWASRYGDSSDCAITRALHRAGYTKLHDAGKSIIDNKQKKVVSNDNDEYVATRNKVCAMYWYATKDDNWSQSVTEPIEPEDFTVTINF